MLAQEFTIQDGARGTVLYGCSNGDEGMRRLDVSALSDSRCRDVDGIRIFTSAACEARRCRGSPSVTGASLEGWGGGWRSQLSGGVVGLEVFGCAQIKRRRRQHRSVKCITMMSRDVACVRRLPGPGMDRVGEKKRGRRVGGYLMPKINGNTLSNPRNSAFRSGKFLEDPKYRAPNLARAFLTQGGARRFFWGSPEKLPVCGGRHHTS